MARGGAARTRWRHNWADRIRRFGITSDGLSELVVQPGCTGVWPRLIIPGADLRALARQLDVPVLTGLQHKATLRHPGIDGERLPPISGGRRWPGQAVSSPAVDYREWRRSDLALLVAVRGSRGLALPVGGADRVAQRDGTPACRR
jgi:hypothetical protein